MTKSNTFNIYFDQYNQLPDFIVAKSPSHKVIWDQMHSINENLFTLFKDVCLSQRRIDAIHIRNEIYLDIMNDALSSTNIGIGYDIHEYYKDLFLSFIGIAEANEDYEIANNLNYYYNSFIK